MGQKQKTSRAGDGDSISCAADGQSLVVEFYCVLVWVSEKTRKRGDDDKWMVVCPDHTYCIVETSILQDLQYYSTLEG